MYRLLRTAAVGGGLVALLATTSLSASAATSQHASHPALHQHLTRTASGGRVTAADYAKRAVTASSRKHAAHGKASALQVQAATSAVGVAGLAPAASALAAVAGPQMTPGAKPDYFGDVPNYANSQLPSGGAEVVVAPPGGSGTTALASASVELGQVTGVTVSDGGSGYTGSPAVTFTGNGSGARAHAVVVGGITSAAVTEGGSGYDPGNPPAVTFSAPTSATGTQARGTVIIDATGAVSGITVDEAGSGYDASRPVTATITDASSTPGHGATATATVSGTVDSIVVDSPGNGYALTGTGIRKFVDGLPGVGKAGANDLGQYISVAHPDTTTFPGSDYYVIGLVEVQKKLHADLPPTTLRLYVQLNKGTDAQGNLTVVPDPPQYMGPMIESEAGRPTRVTFVNMLPKTQGVSCDRTTLPAQHGTVNGTAYNDTAGCGDLFLPVDTNVMGAGMGPLGMEAGDYAQNRATIHLHGGKTPWISDGTPHQWITQAGESTAYPKGVSVSYVPDMWFDKTGHQVPAGTPGATTDPGDGAETFYYTNQQSARMMFFHDHSYGITRLNVYAGEEAPYVIHDAAERAFESAVADVKADDHTIPLVIQDKTFVPGESQLAAEDPTWQAAKWGGQGNVWMPHVYMPNQNPTNDNGASAMGRWDYGPWFWPPFTGLQHGPVANPLYDPNCDPTTKACENAENPGFDTRNMDGTDGNVSQTMESFFDTMLVNGTPYPTKTVGRQVYRLRILNGSNDRHLDLSLFYAKSNASMWNKDGTLNDADAGEVPTMDATTSAINDPANGCTAAQKATWPHDGRDGGVPACSAAGPDMVQIGNDGGFLPAPAPISSQPIDYEYNRRNIIVLDVLHHGLLLAPAERADVLVDFSKVPAGAKLVLYNDSPAADPAVDPRNDYYTGDPDQTTSGGAPTTQPGYGPNTRTVMQFQVDGALGAVSDGIPAGLPAALRAAYQADQPAPIVPQKAYNGMTLPAGYDWSVDGNGTATPNAVDPETVSTSSNNYTNLADTTKTFTPVGGGAPVTVAMQPKAIVEEFDPVWGRMMATLGAELPNTNANVQTTVPLGYAEPANEVLDPHQVGSRIGTLSDGTQIWKITHNGVDSHPVHFHLFDVQLVNRVGWDGAKYAPEANELGWKDTVLMHPLEDTVVALRPQVPTLPFKIPNSVRPIDPAMPIGSPIATFDPKTGQATTVPNTVTDYGWEYVWHCHMLSHEEMDFMRPVVVHGAPPVPGTPTATPGFTSAALAWTQSGNGNPLLTNYAVQRSTTADFSAGVTDVVTAASSPALTTPAYTDTGLAPLSTYWYRVRSESAGGYSAWSPAVQVQTVMAAPTGVQVVPVPSGRAWTSTVSWTAPDLTGLPAGVTVTAQVQGHLTRTPVPVTGSSWQDPSPVAAGSTTGYQVRFVATSASGAAPVASAWTSALGVAVSPGAPTATPASAPPASIRIAWGAAPAAAGRPAVTGYEVQRSTSSAFVADVQSFPAPGTSYVDTTALPGTSYSYRVRATYAGGLSGWSSTVTTSMVFAPTGLTVVAGTPATDSTGRYRSALTWVLPHAYTGEQVQRSTTATFTAATTTTAALAGDAAGWADPTAATPGSTVYYRVRGVVGTGATAVPSAWTTVSTTSPATPVTPAVAVRAGTSTARPSFTVTLTRAAGTPAPTRYAVTYDAGTGPVTVTVPASTTGATTTATVGPLLRRTTYTVSVVASNGLGSAPASAPVRVTTP